MGFVRTALVLADTRPYTPPKGIQAVIGVVLLVLAGVALLMTVVIAVRVRRLRYLYANRPAVIEQRLARAKEKQQSIAERRSRQPPRA